MAPLHGHPQESLTYEIIGAAMRVRHKLGAGLLEKVYQTFLEHELRKAGLQFVAQRGFPIQIDGLRINVAFRADLVVENAVIVELKTVATILPVHKAQILTYLRLANIPVGLLMNFHAVPFKKGIHRFLNDVTPF